MKTYLETHNFDTLCDKAAMAWRDLSPHRRNFYFADFLYLDAILAHAPASDVAFRLSQSVLRAGRAEYDVEARSRQSRISQSKNIDMEHFVRTWRFYRYLMQCSISGATKFMEELELRMGTFNARQIRALLTLFTRFDMEDFMKVNFMYIRNQPLWLKEFRKVGIDIKSKPSRK